MWSNTGLLEGLTARHKQICAIKFEETAHLLLKYPTGITDRMEIIIFPIIRRMVNKLREVTYKPNSFVVEDEDWPFSTLRRNELLMEVIDAEMVISKVKSLYQDTVENCKKMFDNIPPTTIDYEAEAALILSNQITDYHIQIHINHMLDRDENGVIIIKPK